MKKILCAISAAFLLVYTCIPAMAYTLPNLGAQDGYAVVGTFKVKDSPVLPFWESWKESTRNVSFAMSETELGFAVIPSGATLTFSKRNNALFVQTNTALELHCFVRSGSNYEYSEAVHVTSNFVALGILSGSYFSSNSLPSDIASDDNLFLEHTGKGILIEDDLGEAPPESGGILDWLADFWEKLRDFFVGIFVPEEGYFSEWFETIRNAAMQKLGPVKTFLDAMNSGFSSLQTETAQTSLVFKLPANHFFAGSSAISVDPMMVLEPVMGTIRGLITAICVVLALICCYRHLVVLFEK